MSMKINICIYIYIFSPANSCLTATIRAEPHPATVRCLRTEWVPLVSPLPTLDILKELCRHILNSNNNKCGNNSNSNSNNNSSSSNR